LNQLQKELERSQDKQNSEGSILTAEWASAIDIKEEHDKFILQADIPGVKPEDSEVNMEAGVLTVKGEKRPKLKPRKKVINGLNGLMVLSIGALVCRILLMVKQSLQNANMAYWKLSYRNERQ
jgi:hypothetical protein